MFQIRCIEMLSGLLETECQRKIGGRSVFLVFTLKLKLNNYIDDRNKLNWLVFEECFGNVNSGVFVHKDVLLSCAPFSKDPLGSSVRVTRSLKKGCKQYLLSDPCGIIILVLVGFYVNFCMSDSMKSIQFMCQQTEHVTGLRIITARG